jgi:CelD/BcsL family acetyltransferase involved in cellulose biosynthesis
MTGVRDEILKGNQMQIRFIRDEKSFADYAGVWNQLLAKSSTNVPFLRHEFLHTWWSALGGGEWASGDLWIGEGKDSQEDLIGIAPLFITQVEGRRTLMFIGSHEIADYLDFISPAEHNAAFLEALCDALLDDGPAGWEILDLYNIPVESPSLNALEKIAQDRDWRITKQTLDPCPWVELDGGWEDYLSRLVKKQRHELRRKMRRSEQHVPSVTWKIVEPGDDLECAADEFLALMANDPQKGEFLSAEMRAQFHQLIQSAQEAGWLQLSFLKVGDGYAAGYLNFDYANRIWIYNSGMDLSFRDVSPGWVLLGYIIRWAAENGRDAVDFLRGDENYKYRLGGVDRSIVRLTIERDS